MKVPQIREMQIGALSHWRRQPEILRDAVGALPLVLTFLVAQQLYGPGGHWLRAVVIVAVMWGALAVRRRWPLLTFVAALLTVLLAMTGVEFLAVAGYTLAAHRSRVPAPVVVLASAVVSTAGFLRWWPELTLEAIAGDLILIFGVSVVPATLGRAVARSRRVSAELETRNAELVSLRHEAASHAVQRERYRVAREIHDVVAHHVSAMTVRARAGHHVASRDPEAAVEALAYVADEGTDALNAMGALVGALRGGASDDSRGAAPPPGLDDIPELLTSFRGAGLTVHADLCAPPTPVGAATGLTTFRIVQEALTNILRHSGAERAWVRLWLSPSHLHVRIDDDGCGPPEVSTTTGHGLIGLSERAALHGGQSQLSTSPRGGCRLEAALRLPAGRAVRAPAALRAAEAPP